MSKFKVGDLVRYSGMHPEFHDSDMIDRRGKVIADQVGRTVRILFDDGGHCGCYPENLELVTDSPEVLVETATRVLDQEFHHESGAGVHLRTYGEKTTPDIFLSRAEIGDARWAARILNAIADAAGIPA